MQFRWTRPLSVGLFMALVGGFGTAGVGCSSQGEEDGPALSAEPAALDFGSNVEIGDSASLDVLLTSSGVGDVTITDFLWTGDTRTFKAPDADFLTLNQGATTTFTFTFGPTTTDLVDATLTITTNSPLTPNVVITMQGQGYSPDDDGDGFSPSQGDCDDDNEDVNPNATEVCNEDDDDCNGEIDDDAYDAVAYYTDADQDGYGDPDTRRPTYACEDPGDEYAPNDEDCNDELDTVNPAALEVCDPGNTDENCDGEENEGFDENGDAISDCVDNDDDSYSYENGDCNDDNSEQFPGAVEQPGNGEDDNCDGVIDENSAPTIEIVTPDPGNTVVSPGDAVTISAKVSDDYDDVTTLAADVTAVRTDVEDGALTYLCRAVSPEESGTFSCETELEYGAYSITVSVTDSMGGTGTASFEIRANNFPEVAFLVPESGEMIAYGTSMEFTVSVNDRDGETFAPTDVLWTSNLQGNLTPDAPPTPNGDEITAQLTLTIPGEHIITAEVTDELGGPGNASVTVIVESTGCVSVVALWRFDEGSGSSFYDQIWAISGSGTSTSWESGPTVDFKTALAFSDEEGSAATIEDPSGFLQLHQQFTIDLWFQPRGFTGGGPGGTDPYDGDTVRNQALFYKAGDAGSGYQSYINYFLRVDSGGYASTTVVLTDGRAVVAAGNGSNQESILIKATGDWYHIAAVFDGRYLRTYVNGVLQQEADTGTNEVELLTGDTAVFIGNDNGDPDPLSYSLNGIIDEIQVMDCPLVTADIQAYYASNLPHLFEIPAP